MLLDKQRKLPTTSEMFPVRVREMFPITTRLKAVSTIFMIQTTTGTPLICQVSLGSHIKLLSAVIGTREESFRCPVHHHHTIPISELGFRLSVLLLGL